MISTPKSSPSPSKSKRSAKFLTTWIVAIVVALSLCAAPAAAFGQQALDNSQTARQASSGTAQETLAPASLTLQAQAAKTKKYKVVFKANKGTGTMKAQVIKRGKATKLSANKFKRAGYRFAGWNTKKNGKGKAYKNKQSVKNLAKAGKKVVLYAQWKKAPKFKFDTTYEAPAKSIGVGDVLHLYTNNPIAKVKLSDSRILVRADGSKLGKTSFHLVGNEIGKTTITLTSTSGQTLKTTVRVTLASYDTKWKSSKLNKSLKPPKAVCYCPSTYSISAYCKAHFKDGDYSRGYQMYASTNKNFKGNLCQGTADQVFGSAGYACPGVNGTGGRLASNEYYVKLRSYRIVGNVMQYGPWGKTKRVEIPNTTKKRSGTAKYTYQLYNLNPFSVTAGSVFPVFIKTDNPLPYTISLYDGADEVFSNIPTAGQQQDYSKQVFDNIKYSNSYDSHDNLHRVKGGYVCYVRLDNAGTRTIQVRECNKNGYVVAKKVKVKAGDYETEFNAWVDGMIKKAKATNLNPQKKLEAVVEWILGHEHFTYPAHLNGESVDLVGEFGPYFKTKVWNSYVSPAALYKIAEHIGGFDEIHNCYGDYPYGTDEWANTHYLCRVTYKGKDFYYEVCPSIETGYIDKISYIDFADTSKLKPLQ